MKKIGNLKLLFKSKVFISVFFITIISMAGLGVALWNLSNSSTTALIITSTAQIQFSDNLETTEIDTTNSSFQKIEDIVLLNNDGILEYNVSLIESVIDLADGCIEDGGVSYTTEYNSNPVSHGSRFNVTDGLTNFTITTDVERWTCPQNSSLSVLLQPTGN